MKKILMLGMIDPQKNDASKIHFYELANGFVNNGNQVTLLVPKNRLPKHLSKAQKIIHLPLNYSESFIRILILSILQLFYYHFISSNDYDFVYIRIRLFPSFFIKLIHKIKKIKTKIFAEQAGWLEKEIEIQEGSFISKKIGKCIQLIDARFADKVIAMTSGIKDRLLQHNINSKKIFVVQNGTNISHFYPKSKLEIELFKNKNNLGDHLYLGFIGNISKWQGLDDLILAFSKIEKKYPYLHLLVVGSGLYLQELKEKVNKLEISDKIHFLDDVSYDEINDWMNLIDIAFAPKIKQLDGITSPLKLRDYAASGNAVISTNIRGIREFEKHGWLLTYEPANQLDLQGKIELLLNNPQKIEEMKIKSRKFAKEFFSWDIIANKIVDIYEKQNL